MSDPLTFVLRRIFVAGFYRAHSGMLVFLFVVLVSYCFFINTLGNVPPDQITFWQFFFTISLVSNPLMMILYLLACLLYTYKSWQYISTQLLLPNHQFLFYSVNSLKIITQFRYWFQIQLYIFIPVLAFTFYAVIVGVVFGYYLIPACILIFPLFLICMAAVHYTHMNNTLMDLNQKSQFFKWARNWQKPIFLLYTFQVFHQSKLAYSLTKILSWILISGVFFVFSDLQNDMRLLMLVSLFIALAHGILVYQERNFNDRYLGFVHNLPYSKLKLFWGFALNYLVLLMPEILFIFSRFHFGEACILILFALSVILLYRSMLYWAITIKGFLTCLFGLLFLYYLFIMFGQDWILVPVNCIWAGLIFSRNYQNERLLE